MARCHTFLDAGADAQVVQRCADQRRCTLGVARLQDPKILAPCLVVELLKQALVGQWQRPQLPGTSPLTGGSGNAALGKRVQTVLLNDVAAKPLHDPFEEEADALVVAAGCKQVIGSLPTVIGHNVARSHPTGVVRWPRAPCQHEPEGEDGQRAGGQELKLLERLEGEVALARRLPKVLWGSPRARLHGEGALLVAEVHDPQRRHERRARRRRAAEREQRFQRQGAAAQVDCVHRSPPSGKLLGKVPCSAVVQRAAREVQGPPFWTETARPSRHRPKFRRRRHGSGRSGLSQNGYGC